MSRLMLLKATFDLALPSPERLGAKLGGPSGPS
jgi:hypothetical protein